MLFTRLRLARAYYFLLQAHQLSMCAGIKERLVLVFSLQGMNLLQSIGFLTAPDRGEIEQDAVNREAIEKLNTYAAQVCPYVCVCLGRGRLWVGVGAREGAAEHARSAGVCIYRTCSRGVTLGNGAG